MNYANEQQTVSLAGRCFISTVRLAAFSTFYVIVVWMPKYAMALLVCQKLRH